MVNLWRTQTHGDIIEFQNFLLQLKNQNSVDRFVFNFSIFSFERNENVVKDSMHFIRQEYKI